MIAPCHINYVSYLTKNEWEKYIGIQHYMTWSLFLLCLLAGTTGNQAPCAEIGGHHRSPGPDAEVPNVLSLGFGPVDTRYDKCFVAHDSWCCEDMQKSSIHQNPIKSRDANEQHLNNLQKAPRTSSECPDVHLCIQEQLPNDPFDIPRSLPNKRGDQSDRNHLLNTVKVFQTLRTQPTQKDEHIL